MIEERCAQEHSGKLKVQQAESGKSRSLRRNLARLNTSVTRLEEDMEKLERVCPQAWASHALIRAAAARAAPGPADQLCHILVSMSPASRAAWTLI